MTRPGSGIYAELREPLTGNVKVVERRTGRIVATRYADTPGGCGLPAERERHEQPTSEHCTAGKCDWHLSGEPMCPHPRGCDKLGRCAHPFGERDRR